MKSLMLFLLFTGLCFGGQNINQHIILKPIYVKPIHIPVSKRLTASYDSTKDEKGCDPELIIIAKNMMLSFMDSLEIIFHTEFESMPNFKFGMPKDIPKKDSANYFGFYRGGRDNSVYINEAERYLESVKSGTDTTSEFNRTYGKDFKRTLVHELGHYYQDILSKKLKISKILTPSNLSSDIISIQYKLIIEGFSEWLEQRYFQEKKEYTSAKAFHKISTSDEEFDTFWRSQGYSLVGPILDMDPQKGLIDLLLHPFKIRKERISITAKRYQDSAIARIKRM